MWLQPRARSGAEIVRAGCDVQQTLQDPIPCFLANQLKNNGMRVKGKGMGCPCGGGLMGG
jgi:hypothetical protein